MHDIPTRFAVVFGILRAAIGLVMGRDQSRAAIFALVYSRIGRAVQRLEILFTRWRAGTLPTPRPARPSKPRTLPEIRLSRRHAWLAQAVPNGTSSASQLQHLMAQPDVAEFLAAVPRAARILRPLCYMLGIPAKMVEPPRAKTAALLRAFYAAQPAAPPTQAVLPPRRFSQA